MKKLGGLIVLVAILTFTGWAFADMAKSGAAGGATPAAGAQTVKGEVQKIEGENYVVKDELGKEVKLHVNAQTKKEGDIKVGDRIEAQADASGHATSIKAAK
jgi:parvulin-like peptidyl-prolyl isomerase